MKIVFLILVVLFGATPAHSYSVLAHEAIIDFLWTDSIVPVLKDRFPDATEATLQESRRYAYGGCLIQDMGYYPYGSRFFTDLLHYVRSADFVISLIDESESLNEYAFALGALSHFVSDSTGHPIATNRVVPILYPELKARHGPEITYEEKPSAHLKAEFGYDVLQVARGHYVLESYHQFIGFDVSLPVLERAFRKTYGLRIRDLFGDLDMAVGTYRHTVSELVPKMTQVAWDLKKDEIMEAVPGASQETFLYRISPKSYDEKWGQNYKKPGLFVRFVSFIVRILPKIGPLKTLDFRPPTPETEKMFHASIQATQHRFAEMLREIRRKTFDLKNQDLDTGKPTKAGEYGMADEAYEKLVKELSKRDFAFVSPELRENILSFYSNADPKFQKQKSWRKLQPLLQNLRDKKPG